MSILKKIGLLILVSFFLTSGIIYAQDNTDEEIEIRQWSGSYDASAEAFEEVVKTQSGWQWLWESLDREFPGPLDTSRDMAVGIFLGTRRTGGYGIDILSAKEEDGSFVVHYVEHQPRGFVTLAFTTPYLITLLPKTDLEVQFKKWDDLFLYLARELALRGGDSTLVQALRDTVVYSREGLPELSEEITPDAITALMKLLENPNKDIRENAAWAIGKAGAQATAAIPMLVKMLQDQEWKVRRQSAWALEQMEEQAQSAVSDLIPVLKDEKSGVRLIAVRALGEIGLESEEVTNALLEALKDPNPDVRWVAADALGKIGSTKNETIPALIGALSDPDVLVRRHAAEALGEIGLQAEAAIPELIGLLSDETEVDGVSYGIDFAAALALSKIGTASIPALEEALKDSNENVRNNAAYALGQMETENTKA